jgi:hypothetical protein
MGMDHNHGLSLLPESPEPQVISARDRAAEIVANMRRCKMPVPDVWPSTLGGAFLQWHTSNVDLVVEIKIDGRLEFTTARRKRGQDGELLSTQMGEGFLSSEAGIDQLMALLLADQTASA